MSHTTPSLGIIGGSGLYHIQELSDRKEHQVTTPFGNPSGPVISGVIAGRTVHFIPRHGIGHRFTPTEVNYRANVWALKQMGVTSVLSVSAVGSLKEEIAPGHLVVPDQIIDRTMGHRDNTFFGDGLVAHVPMADPYCASLRQSVLQSARRVGATVHDSGTLVCIEGPQFSTRAESMLYRTWNAHLVGMTVMPEARLVREASMCYTTLALATDYDCWREETESVNVTSVLEIMKANSRLATLTILDLVEHLGSVAPCHCSHALDFALVTDPKVVPEETRQKLSLLLPGETEPEEL